MIDSLKTRLNHLAVLSVTGKDAIKFLQGQCTQDVAKLPVNSSSAGAFCTAKGRMVTNVWLFKESQDRIWLMCHATSATTLQSHLAKYIAFFRGTELKIEQDYLGFGLNEAAYAEETQSQNAPDSRIEFSLNDNLHYVWLPANEPRAAQLAQELEEQAKPEWYEHEINQKALWLNASQAETWIPQNVNLDAQDGISYTKGCYTGQEVIARLHYKGESKKQLYVIAWTNMNTESESLYANGQVVGTVIQQSSTPAGHVALAVIKTSAIKDVIFRDENQQFQIELLN